MQKKVKRSPSVKVPTTDSKGVKRSLFPLKVVEISLKYPLVVALEHAKKGHKKSFSQSPDPWS